MTDGVASADPAGPADVETAIADADARERAVWEALRCVEDPELPVSIVDLGLVYDVTVVGSHADVALTVTYSGCPGRDMIAGDAAEAVREADGVETVDVDLVYSPPWSVDRITSDGRAALDDFGLAVPGAADRPDPDCHD